MSHLLQRLAMGVIQPSAEPKIRPLQGSIFAPVGAPLQAGSPSPLELEVTETISRSLRSAVTESMEESHESGPSSRRKSEARQTSVEASEGSLLPGERRRAGAIDRPQMETLFPPARNIPEVADLNGAHAPAQRASALNDDENQLGQVFERRSPAAQQGVLSRGAAATTRLIRPSMQEPRQTHSPDPAQKFAAGGMRNEIRREDKSSREPDEIHIHIGRVEVAAVAPPASRPAPVPPARKSIQLDEYLRRTNGRTV